VHTRLIQLLIARGEVEGQLDSKEHFNAPGSGADVASMSWLAATLFAPQSLPLSLPLLAGLAAEAGEGVRWLLLEWTLAAASHHCRPKRLVSMPGEQ